MKSLSRFFARDTRRSNKIGQAVPVYESREVHRHQERTTTTPLRRITVGFLVFGVLGVIAYSAYALTPGTIKFAYSGETCQSRLTFLPSLQRTIPESKFAVTYSDSILVRGHRVVSTKTCFAPRSTPVPGPTVASSAPMGWRLLQTRYLVAVPKPPEVVGSLQTMKPLPITKPLQLSINQPDETFEYSIKISGKQQRCHVAAQTVHCATANLNLRQGVAYKAALVRSFDGKDAQAIGTMNFSTLPAVRVVSTTIQQNEVVVGRPKTVTVVFDKPLVEATAQLEDVTDAQGRKITTDTRIDGTKLIASWPDELPREKNYTLTVTKAVANDNSKTSGPFILKFETSGGPKITATNAPTSNVDTSARLVVTFDQQLVAGQDISKFAVITGVNAGITYDKNQIVYTLQSAPNCTNFTLSVVKGLLGESGMVSTSGWTFNTRTTCRVATTVIGRSVKGQAITAYTYGTGAKTVLFTGGIHGSEPSGMYIMQDWVKYLDSEGYKIPSDRKIVVVPNVNPDAIAANDRYNANGVNIDRNFPSSDWKKDVDIKGGTKVNGGGSAPLSEPETRALVDLTTSLNPRVVVSFHASGNLVGINKVADSAAIGTMYAVSVGYQTMFDNAEEIMGYGFSGEYETWVGEKLGAPAVLVELPNTTGRFFDKHVDTLWKVVNTP
ncbi:MAG: M14 family zinc carboxypeptidase [Candidatus Saccharimonadales bacterium]